MIRVAEAATASDVQISTPSTSSSKKKLPKKSKKKSRFKSKRKSLQKSTVNKLSKQKGELLPIFELSTNASNDLLLDIQHENEGFDLHIGPTMGEEASSYFLMRHSFTYPGSMMTMLQGPMAAVTGGYGYRISAEAVHRDKYVLVGTYSNNTVEGVVEHSWSRNLKWHCTFVAGFESAQQRQMAAMMAQQQGLPPQTESKFPAAISYLDYRGDNWSCRLHVDLMNNQLSCSANRRLYSLSKNLQIGTRLVSSYEKRKSLLEFGGKYQWRSGSAATATAEDEGQKKEGKKAKKEVMGKRKGLNTVEMQWNMDSSTLQANYTQNVTDNAALTARMMWKTSTMNQLMAR